MKKLLLIIIAIILVGGGAFYGGMKYQESKTGKGIAQGDFQNLRNLSPEERQQRLGQLGTSTSGMGLGARRVGNQSGVNFAAGEILAKDDKNITIKLQGGGSKIIFFSGSTKITKLAEGSTDDLEIGKTVSVGGKQNSDGSFTAETLQLRSDFQLPSGN